MQVVLISTQDHLEVTLRFIFSECFDNNEVYIQADPSDFVRRTKPTRKRMEKTMMKRKRAVRTTISRKVSIFTQVFSTGGMICFY